MRRVESTNLLYWINEPSQGNVPLSHLMSWLRSAIKQVNDIRPLSLIYVVYIPLFGNGWIVTSPE